jgi:hypothetical protein
MKPVIANTVMDTGTTLLVPIVVTQYSWTAARASDLILKKK